MLLTKKTKRGLALGGGGSRGSFTIGAIKALSDHHEHFDVVSGTSIGALVGAVYVQQNIENFKAFIDGFDQNSVSDNLFVFPNGETAGNIKYENGNDYMKAFCRNGPSVEPLRKTYAELFNFKEFKKSKIDFACVSFNVSKNKTAVFKKQDMTEENVMDRLIASTAYFPAFNLVEIDGDLYADGGFAKLPLGQAAMDLGADEIVAIALHKDPKDVTLAKGNIKLLIHPILEMKYFLDFDSLTLKEQILQGYLETLKFMDKAPGYIYTFYEEDVFLFESLSRLLDDVARKEQLNFSSEMILSGMSELLGYMPGPLNNRYMREYSAGLILEILGLIAGVYPYKQYHVNEFISLIDEKLKTLKEGNESWDAQTMTVQMDNQGARDMIVFFHGMLESFHRVPPEIEGMKQQYSSLFYLAAAWYILDKFKIQIPDFLNRNKTDY